MFHLFRHALAVIHFNNNLNRDIKRKKDGSQQIKVVYPKFKNGEATTRDVRVKQTFGKRIFSAGFPMIFLELGCDLFMAFRQ